MDLAAKRNAAIVLVLALVVAIVLAASLRSLQLGPGEPFPGAGGGTSAAADQPATRAVPASASVPILRGFLAAAALILAGYILVRLLTFANLKRLAGAALTLLGILVLLLILPKIPSGQIAPMAAEEVAGESASMDYPTSPLGTPPPAFTWIAAIAVVAGAAAVALAVMRNKRGPASMAARIGQDAQEALSAIQAGEDSTNAIVRCYLQMTRLIATQFKLERDRGMTVREFEAALESMALPPEPLRRLRELFEAVRYGARKFTAEEELSALASLSEIASFVEGGA